MKNTGDKRYVELRRPVDEEAPLMGDRTQGGDPKDKTCCGCWCRCFKTCCGCWCRCFVCYVATTTNLPWEIVAYIAGISTSVTDNGTEKDAKESKCFKCSKIIYACLVATIALIGLIAQDIICFRRDRLDKSFLRMIPMGNNTSKFMECHEPSQMVSAIIIPGVIVLWLLFLVLRKRISFAYTWKSKDTEQDSTNCGPVASQNPNYGAINEQKSSNQSTSDPRTRDQSTDSDQRTRDQSTSDQSISDQRTSDQRTSDQVSSDQSTSIRTSDQRTSDQGSSDQSTSIRTSDQRTSDQGSSDQSTSIRTSDQGSSDQSTSIRTSDQRVSDQGSSDQSTSIRTSDQSNSDQSNSNQRTSDQSLSDLVDKIKASGKKPDRYMKFYIPAIPLFYTLCSKAISIGNLFAFKIVDPYTGNEVMDWGESYITGSWKIVLIILSFLGFVAFDLLYTEVIVRYALQCQLNIYFLEFIMNNVQAYKSQNEALKDILKAQKFLKELNENSLTIGLVLLISTLHTANCTVSLLSISKNCTHLQTFVLLARAIQWAFLTLFPIFQAAQVSNTIKKLQETALSMYTPPIETTASESKQLIMKYISGIALNVELCGYIINPWLPYVIVILIFFAIMLEPLGLKWFQHMI